MAGKITNITGVSDSRSAYVIGNLIEKDKQCLVMVSGRSRAEKLAADLSFFCDRKISVMPYEENVLFRYDVKNNDVEIERNRILKRLAEDKNAVVIVPATSAVKRLPPHKAFHKKTIKFSMGEEVDFEEIKETLVEMGYERSDYVAYPGRFAVRGGIIDIFPIDEEEPYRIELFGTQVDSIRKFDIETQRSNENLNHAEIYPVNFLSDGKLNTCTQGDMYRAEHIWDYMLDGVVVVEDLERIYEHLDLAEKESINDLEAMLDKGEIISDEAAYIVGRDELKSLYEERELYLLQPFARTYSENIKLTENLNFNSRPALSYNGHLDLLLKDINMYAKDGYKIIISASSEGRESSIRELIETEAPGMAEVVNGSLSSGMILPDKKIAYISDGNIFNTTRTSRRRKNRSGKSLESFTELKKGDYVVHDSHGIGIFTGIEELKNQGVIRDYIKIKYAGSGVLYVPVEQMDAVQKYIGSDGVSPRINKLGGDEWKRTKARARAAVAEMTEELIELYAKRKSESGYAFSEDTVWQKEFESSFPYEETDDQLRSIEEIKADMEMQEPMDRLLCGDVGYGKTEVAARAIFKCLIEGKQAAILVPTTILASQHYDTLKDRFKDYPFTIEMLSRFRTHKEQEEIVEKLKRGKIDLIIGTHRILSGDVKFNDLGLLVVDEEQRFGVAHKEKIKSLKVGVDVLTLSATPIPRTLNMSLSGIRDMSLITEPPEERYPVQTYVLEQDDLLIREVINREIDRGGQVFIVFNRVRGILNIADKIRSLVPDVKVAVGHGQMSERALEEIMHKFIEGEIQVLVATTIIESGLDIPNANTMIVLDADKCGLAQLYQLRGRVGRSNRVAYAYLMYQKEKVLTELSEKRLRAIREFTEFGAGFKIAMRDMELRGAGNILGAEQSGHMMNVGYELYVRLVDEAARKARGEIVPGKPEEVTVELKAQANIPSWYIDNEVLKLSMYKRIADIYTQDDMADVIDEMTDRFGEVPKEALNLIKISFIRALAGSIFVSRVSEQNGNVYISIGEKTAISPYAISKLNEKYGNLVFFHGGKEPYISFSSQISKIKEDKLDMCIDVLSLIKKFMI